MMETFTTILSVIFVCVIFSVIFAILKDVFSLNLSHKEKYRAQVLKLKRKFFESSGAFRLRLMKHWRNRFHY